MSLNFLKKSSFLTVPTLYLFYLYKRDNPVLAKELEKPTEPPINKSLTLASATDNGRSQRLPNVPVIGLRRSKLESIQLVEALRVIQNAPGVVCGVSYRGEEIWSFGNGLADIETHTPCTEANIMRIASISKPMTMFMLGKLLEQGKLDLDRPISEYLSADKFPEKSFDKQKVEITLRLGIFIFESFNLKLEFRTYY